MQNSKAITLSTPDIATLFGVTPKTVAEWAKAGMPKLAHGKFDLHQAFEWWREEINTSKDTPATETARERYWNAKAEEAEIKVDQTKGTLISRSEVVAEWCKRVAEFRQGCLSMPVKLPPLLEGKPIEQMRQVIKDFSVNLLDGYARDGKFCQGAEAQSPAKAEKGKSQKATGGKRVNSHR